jgi:O-antigen/teichoic acid export membrane protein
VNLNQDFARNVIIVSLGPIIASAFSFIAEPWIARYWEPEIFGLVSYFGSFLLMISPALFLRYNFAIVQCKNKFEEYNLVGLSIAVFSVLFIIIFILFPYFTKFLGSDFPFLRFKFNFFISLFFASLYALLRYWAAFSRKFVQISLSTIILQVSFTILLLIFGYLQKTDTDTIIWIRTISYILGPIALIVIFFWKNFQTFKQHVSLRGIVLVAKKYKRFPLFEFWGFTANLIAFNIPIILIARYWGQEINGLFSKAFFIEYMFVMFVGEAISRVLHKEYSDMVNQGKNSVPFIINTFFTLVQVSLLPFISLILIGPELFELFLGKTWAQSGLFAQNIAMWMFSIVVSLSFSPLFSVLNKQKQFAAFHLVLLFFRIVLLTIFGRIQMDVFNAVLIFSLVNFALLSFQTLYILRVAGLNLGKILRLLLKPALQLIPFVFLVKMIQIFISPSPIFLIIIVFVLSTPYIYLFYLKSTVLPMLFGKLFKN